MSADAVGNSMHYEFEMRRDEFNQKRELMIASEERRLTALALNIEELRKLECIASYALESQTDNRNNYIPFLNITDPLKRLTNVNVAELMRRNAEFLKELGEGSFGFVFLTKPSNNKPSVVKKVFKPIYRLASAHEFRYLSKFKYNKYFVNICSNSLTNIMVEGVNLECFQMEYEPDLISLYTRRKELENSTEICDIKCETYYSVALADIAMGLHHMHTSGLVHGDLTVCNFSFNLST